MVFECVGAENGEAYIITNRRVKGMLLMKQLQDSKVTQSPGGVDGGDVQLDE